MLVESVFEAQKIPIKYTHDGKNVSPPLELIDVPLNAVSLVIIMDDPDAPNGTFDHWIVWNIPPNLKRLGEGAAELNRVSPSPMHGINGFGTTDYQGPSPPKGKPHHYHFKVFALDTQLKLKEGATKKQVEDAMNGHILSQAELIGIYQR